MSLRMESCLFPRSLSLSLTYAIRALVLVRGGVWRSIMMGECAGLYKNLLMHAFEIKIRLRRNFTKQLFHYRTDIKCNESFRLYVSSYCYL
jgi:hypothetical protein